MIALDVLGAQTSNNEPRMECGVPFYRPRYLQMFNSMKSFMGFFTVLLIAYGMAASYTSSVLPSMEKRFGFSSKTMGTILAINDTGIIIMAMVTAHFAGKGNRPRGIFIGSCCCGFALLLLAVPELFFPYSKTIANGNNVAADIHKETLCSPGQDSGSQKPNATVCELQAKGDIGAFAVFAVAEFLLGIGSTCFMILGLPFIDDNVSVDDAPIYFAVSFFGRIFGPMLGFGLGAVCNNIFFDWSVPSFKQTDPRWISAWYMGFLIIGGAVLLFALFIGCFPAEIGRQSSNIPQPVVLQHTAAQGPEPCQSVGSWPEFFTNLKRLLENIPFMCRAFSNVLDGMIITGFLSFFFKFIAQQYQISPAIASLAGGVPTIFGIALGVLGGAALIKKYSLQPRHVCLMLVLSAVLLCIVVLLSIGLGCERTEILGLEGSESLYEKYKDYGSHFNGSYCGSSVGCSCSQAEFTPVCDHNSGVNFFSPCHAGCHSSKIINDVQYYDNCACVKHSEFYDDVDNEFRNGRMKGGFCKKNCPNFYVFVCVFFIAMTSLGLPLAGSIMVQYRLVDVDLKSFSTGFILLLTAAFGYLPAPIFVGAIVDSTCRLWATSSCGDQEFCLLYDTDQFRWRFMVIAAAMKGLGVILDIIVTYGMWNMSFTRPEPMHVNPSQTSISPLVPTISREDMTMTQEKIFLQQLEKNELFMECPESKL